MPPVVAVIHANPATMAPVRSAFTDLFPGAELWHLLDDRLVTEADAAGGLTARLRQRMSSLIEYAVAGGAEAVQLACSMYGPVALDSVGVVPVVPSDQALFDAVVALRPGRVTVLASLRSASEDSLRRLTEALTARGLSPSVEPVVVEEAFTASSAGDTDRLGDLLAEAVGDLETDVVVLAQYSLAPVVDVIRRAVEVPVLSGPHLAASALAVQLRERATSAESRP